MRPQRPPGRGQQRQSLRHDRRRRRVRVTARFSRWRRAAAPSPPSPPSTAPTGPTPQPAWSRTAAATSSARPSGGASDTARCSRWRRAAAPSPPSPPSTAPTGRTPRPAWSRTAAATSSARPATAARLIYGTVFKVAAGSGTITTLASFNGTNGAYPNAGLFPDTAAISSAPPRPAARPTPARCLCSRPNSLGDRPVAHRRREHRQSRHPDQHRPQRRSAEPSQSPAPPTAPSAARGRTGSTRPIPASPATTASSSPSPTRPAAWSATPLRSPSPSWPLSPSGSPQIQNATAALPGQPLTFTLQRERPLADLPGRRLHLRHRLGRRRRRRSDRRRPGRLAGHAHLRHGRDLHRDRHGRRPGRGRQHPVHMRPPPVNALTAANLQTTLALGRRGHDRGGNAGPGQRRLRRRERPRTPDHARGSPWSWTLAARPFKTRRQTSRRR